MHRGADPLTMVESTEAGWAMVERLVAASRTANIVGYATQEHHCIRDSGRPAADRPQGDNDIFRQQES